jgi:hypothetical protein
MKGSHHSNIQAIFYLIKFGGFYSFEFNPKTVTYSDYNTFENGLVRPSQFIPLINENDILFIELRDHGDISFNFWSYDYSYYTGVSSGVPNVDDTRKINGPDKQPSQQVSYVLYREYGDYGCKDSSNKNWVISNNDFESYLNNINAKYLIIELDFCFSGYVDTSLHTGGFIGAIDTQPNRLIISSQDGNHFSARYALLYYDRIFGKCYGKIYLESLTYNEKVDRSELPIYSSNADGVSNVDSNRDLIRSENIKNGIISIQEAYWMANAITSDITYTDGGTTIPVNPCIFEGTEIPNQLYI